MGVSHPNGLQQIYVGSPSDTFLLADGNYLDHEPFETYLQTDYGLMYRHGQANAVAMAFFDGHAETRLFQVPYNQYPDNPGYNNAMPVEAPW